MVQSPAYSFADQSQANRELVDRALAEYIDAADCPARLKEAIRHSLLAPGKRLRPLLTLMSAESCGGTAENGLPAACAVEMVHTYSLIHDDLPAMDDDDLRRGRPTCHRAFDEATAILAGDALLTLAFESLARHVQPPASALRCVHELASAAGAAGMVGGQMDDLYHPFEVADVTELQHIHRRKTGAMFRAAVLLGGITAGAEEDRLAALERYAAGLGLAFQIVDDLLDVDGDEQSLGKRVGKDSGRGKLTYPGLLGAAESRRRAEKLIDEACHSAAELGPAAENLQELARFVLERKR